MKAIAQSEIISLVSDVITFADNSEQLIDLTKTKYKQAKTSLDARHKSEINNFELNCKNSCAAVSEKGSQTIREMEQMVSDIHKMDATLSGADKYYFRAKSKNQQKLADVTSSRYQNETDYYFIFDRIKTEYTMISKKYKENILPGILNGLNYLLSGKRKRDYEELIILKNTADSFYGEITRMLPPLIDEKLREIKNGFAQQRAQLIARQKKEQEYFQNSYSEALYALSDKIISDLDEILPDDFVKYLGTMMSQYESRLDKVNKSAEIPDEILDMFFIDFPVDYFIQSQIVSSIIKDKCREILVNDAIRLPIVMSEEDAPVWLVKGDNSNMTVIQSFVYSVMYGFLISCRPGSLKFRVIDPENHGNSIFPFFDAKKMLPELFGESIIVDRDEISDEIGRINKKIENILQNDLGNQYKNVFEYRKEHPDVSDCVELLLIFDFPKGFDERTLGELRNIIRNGSRCGIYTVISYIPVTGTRNSGEYQNALQSILNLAAVVQQNQETFYYRGLTAEYHPMPEKNGFTKFFGKYMLIYEAIKNKGIVFSPLMKKLADAADLAEADRQIDLIRRMTEEYQKDYGRVPQADSAFPESFILGSVCYPADIFSDSVGYQHILESFGVNSSRDAESEQYVSLPLEFNLTGKSNLFLYCLENARESILEFTHHVIWSFLSFIPVTKADICVFDSEQHGNSVLPLLDFRKKAPDIFDQKIYTNHDVIKERLRKINEHIDEFIQEKLGNKYSDILAYNRNTPRRAEPLMLLVLYDFPGGMDGEAIRLLMNILHNGNKCGIYTMICYNPNISFSRYERIEDQLEQIRRYCASIDYGNGSLRLSPYDLKINIPTKMSRDAANYFADEYVEKIEEVKKQGLSFKDIIAKDLFSKDSSKALEIPVGVGDEDRLVDLMIGRNSSQHGLIAGATGSGKSTLLHTIIMSGMLNYSPDQLHLYLMDFKSGTEFKIYESVRLPHIQLLALDAMQEFGESILENLVKEMEERGRLFKEAGQTSISGYKAATGRTLPRILVIMDEFQILFNDSSNRKVAMNCAELTKRIVTEGRAFGIHLLMATQSTKVISDLTLSRGTIEQMRIRIGLKCGESDARYLFSDENDAKALAMMKGPIGTAVMNLDYTEQPNIGFRVAYCDDKTQEKYLDLISNAFADVPYHLQTFEGGRTTRLLDYFEEACISYTDEMPVRIHMGTLIKVAPPFAINVDRKKRHNLLICGENETMANMIADNYLISALLNKHVSAYCIDGDLLVGDNGDAGFYGVLEQYFPSFKLAESREDIIKFLNEIFSNYKEWKKRNGNQNVVVVIKNLQFIDIIKSMLKGEAVDESDYLEEEEEQVGTPEIDPANPFAAVTYYFENKSNSENQRDDSSAGEKLLKLISDGSGFGINFVVSSLEYQTVREYMYYGENILTKFQERIIFSLGSTDAENLIENVSVSGLRNNTVYFTDGVKNTFLMKPYLKPSDDELEDFLKNSAQG